MKLTDSQIKAVAVQEKPYKLRDGGGLMLLVQPNGSKWWRVRYRFLGKEKTLSLGTYPIVSLKNARLALQEAKMLLREGIDPAVSRVENKIKQKLAAENSFKSVAMLWWEDWRTTKDLDYAEKIRRRLETDLFPIFGAKPITEITAPILLYAAKKIEERGALEIAKRAFNNCGQIFRYAIAHGLAERNPAADIRPSDALKPTISRNYARVDIKDLPELLRKIDNYDGQALTKLAIQLMVLTFVRTSELIKAQWSEFDFEVRQWRVASKRMKMKTPHIVPLSDQAVKVLERIRHISGGRLYLFPGERDPHKNMSNNTILFALYRMGYHSRMTGHGFRGLASTILHEQSYVHEHIELQLAHTDRDEVSAAYNHALYLPQRTKMMQEWADYLDERKLSLS